MSWPESNKVKTLANKSFLTNVISALVFGTVYFSPEFTGRSALMMASLFALSGALTNWLAIYMLFERIPGLYGSGIITLRFDQFKESIRSLVMENFFTEENFVKVAQGALPHKIQPELIMDKIDFDKVFGGFVTAIKNSTFGSMFKLFGGEKALEPLRKPFKAEFEKQASEIICNIDIASVLRKETDFDAFKSKISSMVDTTLNELTPQRVKKIVEDMMRTHLGWLVVWGGVFGALIGFVSAVFF
ncbi:MAG: DUF445 domain-containing protein [Planctomycetes bacterium]|nr:DUF445 domain-containing protein [Planctomycetota bacterium]